MFTFMVLETVATLGGFGLAVWAAMPTQKELDAEEGR